ncbi:MAG: stage III sporulation protein D [Ruminococcaceae bacterium]|nr:stage III sporulation protein D [Oscillospiraceae bacterium]
MYITSEKERCVILASYLVENNATVRAVAQKFGISKSTVHKDVTDVLKKVNLPLYNEVQEVLERNKRERHIRGGEATKKKYRSQWECNN